MASLCANDTYEFEKVGTLANETYWNLVVINNYARWKVEIPLLEKIKEINESFGGAKHPRAIAERKALKKNWPKPMYTNHNTTRGGGWISDGVVRYGDLFNEIGLEYEAKVPGSDLDYYDYFDNYVKEHYKQLADGNGGGLCLLEQLEMETKQPAPALAPAPYKRGGHKSKTEGGGSTADGVSHANSMVGPNTQLGAVPAPEGGHLVPGVSNVGQVAGL